LLAFLRVWRRIESASRSGLLHLEVLELPLFLGFSGKGVVLNSPWMLGVAPLLTVLVRMVYLRVKGDIVLVGLLGRVRGLLDDMATNDEADVFL